DSMRRKFEKHEVLTLMLGSMMPPPFPFKALVLSAAVFEVNLARFVLGIFLGRLVRFSILAILISLFGPQIIELFGAAVRGHLGITLTVLGVLIVAAAIFWLWRGKQRRSTPQATDWLP